MLQRVLPPFKFGNLTLSRLRITSSRVLLVLTFLSTNAIQAWAQVTTVFDNSLGHISNQLIHMNREQDSIPLFNFQHVIPPAYIGTDTLFEFTGHQQATLFIAYTTHNKLENNLAELSNDDYKVRFSNIGIKKENDEHLQDIDASTGTIVTYQLSSPENKSRRQISISDYVNIGEKSGNKLLEMILFPTLLDETSRLEVETYLSIKFGISLGSSLKYISSAHKVIWDGTKQQEFSNRVTGIGRDDHFGLFQKQSQNSSNTTLTIGYDTVASINSRNRAQFDNYTFILWGDNDGPAIFEKDSLTGLNASARIWMTKTFSTNPLQANLLQISVKPDMLFEKDLESTGTENTYWLALYDSLDDFEHIRFVKGIKEGDSFLFNDVKLTEKNYDTLTTSFFRFIVAPTLSAAVNLEKTGDRCPNQKNLNIKILGGLPPFSISIIGPEKNNLTQTTDNFIVFYKQDPGLYSITISDSLKQVYQFSIQINNILDQLIEMPDSVPLDGNKMANLSPEYIHVDRNSNFSIEWVFKSQTISNQPQYTAVETGEYLFKLSDDRGCSLEKIINVIDPCPTQLYIHPNPALNGEEFNVRFNTTNETIISIDVLDAIGRLVARINEVKTSNSAVTHRLFTPGIYFLRIKTNAGSYTEKLIVI